MAPYERLCFNVVIVLINNAGRKPKITCFLNYNYDWFSKLKFLLIFSYRIHSYTLNYLNI